MEKLIETISPPARKKDAAHRTADSYFVTWERRTSLVKQQIAAESAANDAKTARLRALRLAKEATDKEIAGVRDTVVKRPGRKRLTIKV